MTFSSDTLQGAAFVEHPLPGTQFVAQPTRVAAGAATPRRAASLDPAAERARAETASYERGVEAGREQAEAAQGTALASALDALGAALAAVAERERGQAEALAQAGLSLALAVAGQLLRREVAGDLDALTPCLREAFSALAPETGLRLALAPSDLATLRAGGAPALATLAETWHAELVSDPSLAAGEARAEASGAQIELVWDAVMARLEAALRERLAPPEAAP